MSEQTSKPQLLCMFTPSAKGGHARYTYELLRALSSKTPHPHVELVLVTSTDLSPEYRDGGYAILDFLGPIIPREMFGNRIHWAFSRVVYFTRRERKFAKWVHRNDGLAGIHIQEYAPWLAPLHFRRFRAKGIRVFYTAHNIYPHEYPPFVPKLLTDFLTREGLRQCTAIFTHGDGLRNQLADYLGKDCPPIVVIQHGPFRSKSETRASSNALPPPERSHLLFFGTIRSDKGLEVLLLAMRNLPEFHLTIAGEPTSREIRDKIKRGLASTPPGQVELFDRYIEEEEIADLFAASSAVILPYTSFSGQSGVLLQAVAHGKPVVVTDVAGLGADTLRWEIGEVAPPSDPLALAGAIRRLHQPKRYEAAVAAAAKLEKTLSWESAAKATMDTYLLFLSGTTRPPPPTGIKEGGTIRGG